MSVLLDSSETKTETAEDGEWEEVTDLIYEADERFLNVINKTCDTLTAAGVECFFITNKMNEPVHVYATTFGYRLLETFQSMWARHGRNILASMDSGIEEFKRHLTNVSVIRTRSFFQIDDPSWPLSHSVDAKGVAAKLREDIDSLGDAGGLFNHAARACAASIGEATMDGLLYRKIVNAFICVIEGPHRARIYCVLVEAKKKTFAFTSFIDIEFDIKTDIEAEMQAFVNHYTPPKQQSPEVDEKFV